MNARTTALLTALLATGGATLADVTVPGNVVVPAGGTLLISDNTTYSGSLTIEAGAQVVMGSNWQVLIANGASLTVNGTEAEPVTFLRSNGDWNGIRMLNGSVGTMNHARIQDAYINAIRIDDASLTMNNCSVYDESTTSMSYNGTRIAVRLYAGAELTMNESEVGPFYGKIGGGGSGGGGGASNGFNVYGILANGAESLTIANSRFERVRGGAGGKGGQGSTGGKGDNAPDAILFNGIQGDKGKTGGTGGDGGRGGNSYNVVSIDTDETTVAQNVFITPTGGQGGQGGKGGTGGKGGDGGDGAGGVVGNGGKGGKGGTGGNGGKGGVGGESGDVFTVYIDNPTTEPLLVNNTFYAVTARIGGTRGDRGSGGPGGTGGSGGGAGLGGSTGSSGSTGSGGSIGTYGTAGPDGEGRMVYARGQAPTGFVAKVHNNVSTFNGPGFTRAFESVNDGVMDVDYNLIFNASDTADGPVIGALINANPIFVSGADYRLMPGSPAIDAGWNDAVPAVLELDYNGDARFQDDLALVDTGLGTGEIVDLGAFEAPGEVSNPCVADVNGDGILDNGDIGSFVNLFLVGDLGADFNSDGILDNGDIGAFVEAFLAGC